MANIPATIKRQVFTDLRNGSQVSVTHIKVAGGAGNTDTVLLPKTVVDARLVKTSSSQTLPSVFYLGGGGKPNLLSIDAATANNEFLVVAHHTGFVNFGGE